MRCGRNCVPFPLPHRYALCRGFLFGQETASRVVPRNALHALSIDQRVERGLSQRKPGQPSRTVVPPLPPPLHTDLRAPASCFTHVTLVLCVVGYNSKYTAFCGNNRRRTWPTKNYRVFGEQTPLNIAHETPLARWFLGLVSEFIGPSPTKAYRVSCE